MAAVEPCMPQIMMSENDESMPPDSETDVLPNHGWAQIFLGERVAVLEHQESEGWRITLGKDC